ncbi:MAG: hypothetical protein AB2L13_00860 [Spirochaetota bacterium]
MSLLKSFFKKTSPINRFGGTGQLATVINLAAHKWANSIFEEANSKIQGFNQEDSILLTSYNSAIYITILSVMLREFFKTAELWDPNDPQKFVDDLCTTVVMDEWGSDTEMIDLMFEAIQSTIHTIMQDEKKEEIGEIEAGTRIFRACGNGLRKLKFKSEYSLDLTAFIIFHYPEYVGLNRKSLESVKAATKDGVYIG